MSSVSKAPSFSRRAAAMSLAHACTASTCLVASGVCEPTWKDRPRTPMPRSAARRASASRSSGSQPNLRDRSHDRARGAERDAQQQLRAAARGARTCAPRRDCRRRRCARRTRSALAMSAGRLMGCVWMQRSGATPRRLHQLHLPGGGQIEEAALADDRLHHRRMRQRLERVVQVDAAAAPCAACGTARARARSRGSAAASRTPRPGGGLPRAGTGSMNRGRRTWRKFTAARPCVPVPSSLSAMLVAARSRRSRIASQRSPSGTSCTRMCWQPALSSVRRLVYRSRA